MNEVRAEMAGLVHKVHVKVGDVVEAGDALLVIESMKMEIPVLADVRASVTTIMVTEGEMIEDDATLVVIDPT